MIDNRRWHIYKDATTPTKPWHVELTVDGKHIPSPNEPAYAAFDDAAAFVGRHVTGYVRRQQLRLTNARA